MAKPSFDYRVIMLVLDGVGDRPVKELGATTPLVAAKTPNLDRFAKEGITGMMHPIAPGIRAGSDTSHLALLGYDPYKVYTGRGPFEAAGAGLDLLPGDIAMRANFATIDDRRVISDRRAGRIKTGGDKLASILDGTRIGDVDIIFKATVEHRAVIVFRGKGLDPHISDMDPHKVGGVMKDCVPLGPGKGARRTAEVVNQFWENATACLKDHEVNKERARQGLPQANTVLLRGAGITPEMPTLKQAHGWEAASIAGVSLIRGICRLAGMKCITAPGMTGGIDTNMLVKARESMKALNDHDFVFVNVKAPDVCGHDGDWEGKTAVCERIDEMMGVYRSNLTEDVLLIVTADHSTPVTVMDHSGDPVPFLMHGEGVRPDSVTRFNEFDCARGTLNGIRGTDVMNLIMNITNRAEKFGA